MYVHAYLSTYVEAVGQPGAVASLSLSSRGFQGENSCREAWRQGLLAAVLSYGPLLDFFQPFFSFMFNFRLLSILSF